MKLPFRFVLVPGALAVTALALAGCVAEPTNGPGASERICIVLPDADPAGRWEQADRPALQAGFAAADLAVDVRSADGDPASAVADQLDDGCGVLVLAAGDGAMDAAAAAVAAGVPVIAYDGAVAGATSVVAFDEAESGRLQGQSLVDAFAAEGRAPGEAVVVYLTGTGLGEAEREGALTALRAGGVRPAAEPVARPDETPDAAFARALAGLSNTVDAVWAPDDAAAAAATSGLAAAAHGPVPLSGGRVTTEALRRILAGWQTSGVLLPTDLEAQAAVDLAVSLLRPAEGATAPPPAEVLVSPRFVGAADLPALVTEGVISADELCAGEVLGVVLAERCAAAGIG